MQNIETAPQETFNEADVLMKNMVERLMAEKDVAVQLMNTNFGQENVFFHSLNVSVLAMMLGKEYGLDAESLRVLGLGALFHDVGKNNIPKNIIRKKGLSGPERRLLQLHPKYGVDILSRIEDFPKDALQILYQHHERSDGLGYPLALSNEKITVLARIASIVNAYDNHCNKYDYKESLTPYESLAYMFSVQGDFFDKELLSLFIHCLGVYPPGTIVKLTNGNVGMIVSVDPASPLQPSLILHDPEIPKKEAMIISLQEEPELSIEGSIRPSALPQNIFDYLSPRTRVTYYVDEYVSRAGKTAQN
jgi:putative nucleotidyltransferase with HDIG domain